MEYTRALKYGLSGEDVFYIKNKLFNLGYYDKKITKIQSKTFGNDTILAVKAFQKTNKDSSGKPLQVDGIIGPKTWSAIEQKDKPIVPVYTRLIKYKMSGSDVRYMKECLFKLKYYANNIKQITNNTYGNDTLSAVKSFQITNKLAVDTVIGPLTWAAIEKAYNEDQKKPDPAPSPEGLLKDYLHISADKRQLIEQDLIKTSPLRREIAMELLNYCYDKDVPGDPRGLYIWGGNLYNTDLKLNIVTAAKIDKSSTASTAAKTWMKNLIKKYPNLPGSDCSGAEVGWGRKYKLTTNTFDATANTLGSNTHSTKINKSALQPGDFVWKTGHIGTYIGGGYVIEFYGSNYGCQLTKIDKRQGYDFISKTVKNGSAWTEYRKCKWFKD